MSIIFIFFTYRIFAFSLIQSQSAPLPGSSVLFSMSAPTKIFNFFTTYFVFGSITDNALFGLTPFQFYTFPLVFTLLFVYRKIFKLNLKIYLLLFIPVGLIISAQFVGLDISPLHNIGQFFTFPWNSNSSRLYSALLICLIAFIPYLKTNHYVSNSYHKYLFPAVSLNFLYINLITIYAYGN